MTSAMDVGWRLYDENSKLQCNFFKEAKKIDNMTSYKSTAIGKQYFISIYFYLEKNFQIIVNYKD